MGESRERCIAHKIGLRGPETILCAAAAWARVHGHAPRREELFRAVAELEGRTVLSCYALQRVCWERGWLRCGTCEVTAEGWAEIGEGPESRRAA